MTSNDETTRSKEADAIGRVSGRLLEAVFRARLVVVTGKGGVGKTTVSAALSQLGAASGRRILACEVGSQPGAPSRLGEALTGKPTASTVEPMEIAPNLDLVLLSPEEGHRAFLHDVLPFGFLADRALNAKPLQRFLSATPALLELGILYRGLALMKQKQRNGAHKWDTLILDAPATGHAVAFASLPEVALRIFPTGPIGRALREGIEVLSDPHRTVAVITTLPESLPVAEALELKKGLEDQNLRVEGIIANIVPADPFTADEHEGVQAWLLRHQESGGGAPAEILGHRTMGRLNRAKNALNRLRSEAEHALVTVREQREAGMSLVDWVASELAGA